MEGEGPGAVESGRNGMTVSSKSAVVWALGANVGLTVLKGVAFFVSGSGAMLSEAVHSMADSGNQALLWVGIRRSERPADARYPYGYGGERFLFALLSAVGIFVFGCGVTIYHGVRSLIEPPELHFGWLTWAVLAASLFFEGISFLKAYEAVKHAKGKQGFRAFLHSTTDPSALAILLEDAVAGAGIFVAALGIGLSAWTGNPLWDALGSIGIGLMMGFVALWLALKNRTLILGRAVPEPVRREALAFLRAQPSVEKVREVKTRVLAADRFGLQADLDFDGRVLGAAEAAWVRDQFEKLETEADFERFAAEFGERIMQALGREVDRIENELAERLPQLRYIDLEAD